MQAEIVAIGTDLLLGQILDTNATYIAKLLAENGINLFQKTTVGDNRERILKALDAALERADIVLVSGGLGPTEDDITRECVAELTGRPLELREDLLQRLVQRFARARRPLTENNKKQAYAPRGALIVENPNGTAPGLILEEPRGVIVCLPGVPHELRAMLESRVIPYLHEKFGVEGLVHCRILKVCGVGESQVDAAIADLIRQGDNPKIGLLAAPEAVQIRISARARNLEDANRLIDSVEARVRQALPGLVMGVDDETIEEVVDRLLAERGWTLAVAETHTGGMIGQRLVAAGARQFVGGLVVPPNRRVQADLAVVAAELARTIRGQYNADCILAVAGDLDAHRALARLETPEGTTSWEFGFHQLDGLNQLRNAVTCLEQVRRKLAGVAEGKAAKSP